MTIVYTKRPLPIGVTVVRSQTRMELGPDELVEKLSWQGFIETEAVKLAREKPKEKLTEPEKKLTKKPEKSG